MGRTLELDGLSRLGKRTRFMLRCPLLGFTSMHCCSPASKSQHSGAYLLKVHNMFMKFFSLFLQGLGIIESNAALPFCVGCHRTSKDINASPQGSAKNFLVISVVN